MTKSYNQLNPAIQSKLELLGLDADVKYIIQNQSILSNPKEQLEVILNHPSMSTASLRAPEGYHLPKIMQNLETGLLGKFGGHPCAAGFSTGTTQLPMVKKGFLDYLADSNQGALDMTEFQSSIPTDIINRLSLSMQASLDKNVIFLDYNSLNLSFLAEVFGLEPFGIDFPFPYFLFELPNQFLSSRKIIGQSGSHIKLNMNNGINLTFFNLDKELIASLNNTDRNMMILAKLSQNSWNNTTKLELIGESVCLG